MFPRAFAPPKLWTLDSLFRVAGAVAFITFLAYLRTLQNGFVNWDDDLYVLDNRFIRSFNLAFFRWAFLDFHASNWHPLTWISHAMDYAVWGLNPLGHHLSNNILHAGNAFLVVVLTARLLMIGSQANRPHPEAAGSGDGRTRSGRTSALSIEPAMLIAGAVTGLLFGLHPFHVESVAWVAERKDLLCAFFFLLSIIAYLRYALPTSASPRRRWYFISLASFALALMSKPMAVSLPLVLLVLDWYPLARVRSLGGLRALVLEKVPFAALALGSSILTLLAQRAGGALKAADFAPFSTRVLVAFDALLAYLGKMAAPLNLLPLYPYPQDVSLSPRYLTAVVVALGIAATSLVMAKRRKWLFAAGSYYVLTLTPVLGIVQVGDQAMADRYTYLPSLGPFLCAGLAAGTLWRMANAGGRRKAVARIFVTAAAFFLFTCLAYATYRQTGIWKDSVTLWSSVIDKGPAPIPLAYYNRGLAHFADGALDRAMKDYDRAIALDPSYYKAFNNRGVVFMQAGSFAAAIGQFTRAVDIEPGYPVAYGNRGLAAGRLGRYDQALVDLNRAIALDPGYGQAYLSRGNVYLMTGRKNLALPDVRAACELGEERGCAAWRALTARD